MRCALLIAMVSLAVAAAPAVARARLAHFQSPSGNINCVGSDRAPIFVDCLVRTGSWQQPPPKPARCDLDWNPYEAQLVARRVTVGACRGDVGPRCFHDCTTLRYGRAIDFGTIRCRSAANGVTCRYVSGRLAGFRIAREAIFVWRR